MTLKHKARLKAMSASEKATYLEWLSYLDEVARTTGRVLFGQLWDEGLDVSPFSVNFIMEAQYMDAIIEQLNNSTPLSRYFREAA